jgi:hypothetical protein
MQSSLFIAPQAHVQAQQGGEQVQPHTQVCTGCLQACMHACTGAGKHTQVRTYTHVTHTHAQMPALEPEMGAAGGAASPAVTHAGTAEQLPPGQVW